MEIIFLVACGWLGDKIRRRLLVSLVGMSTALLGIVLIVGLPLSNSPGRLAGYYMTQASAAPFVALLSLIGTNVAGYTKKTTVSAMYLIAYCKCYTPLFYQPHILTRSPHRCRQFHRPTDLQTKRCPSICACRDHDHNHVQPLYCRRSLHPLLVRKAEQGQGKEEARAWIHQAREPGVARFDRQGEPGIRVYLVIHEADNILRY